ncbi:hypothetical protein WMY93_021434 [Mugilogobius chulae]|uniref:3-hydroxyacyl-CoA dehydrogenase NAD binding domain-containing protein n=1 Tax=Mugilogobius chulae TaxID=88201 RepID=A0AAW0NLY4_9GOBI
MKVVTVIGSGLIGRSWALVFISGGFSVKIYDKQPGMAASALSSIRTQELCGAFCLNHLLRARALLTSDHTSQVVFRSKFRYDSYLNTEPFNMISEAKHVGPGQYLDGRLLEEPQIFTCSNVITEVRASETAGYKAADPKSADSEVAGPEAASPETAGPKSADPEVANPKTAGARTAGPKTAGSEAENPKTAGPEAASSENGCRDARGFKTARLQTDDSVSAGPQVIESPQVLKMLFDTVSL